MTDEMERPEVTPGTRERPAAPDSEWWAWLRRPFPPNAQGKLTKSKSDYSAPECNICGAKHQHPHGGVHVDYIGHAFLRERLNDVEWSMEPYLDPQNNPVVVHEPPTKADDKYHVVWMPFKMTVMGVVKEEVAACSTSKDEWPKVLWSDAITRGAMAHGIGLWLWQKDMPVDREPESERPQARHTPAAPPSDDEIGEWVAECRSIASRLTPDLQPTWASWKDEHDLPEFPKGAMKPQIQEALKFLRELAEEEPF